MIEKMSTFASETPSGVHPSPNIQSAPDIYEIENRAADPENRIEMAMATIAPWDGKVLLDLGAGTGFHIPRFHAWARQVIAVEPHGQSRERAQARVAELRLDHVSVIDGSAERLPLRDASVDIVHARFAYFFAPDCEPGLAELARVIRAGGTAFIIDNDLSHGTFASWLQRSSWISAKNGAAVERFWDTHGFTLVRIASEWRFDNRDDLEAVVRLEFPGDLAEQILSEHVEMSVEYYYSLYHRQY
jgi:ubiquinone/menaquinone biosynthesis C-methylase UbiE